MPGATLTVARIKDLVSKAPNKTRSFTTLQGDKIVATLDGSKLLINGAGWGRGLGAGVRRGVGGGLGGVGGVGGTEGALGGREASQARARLQRCEEADR